MKLFLCDETVFGGCGFDCCEVHLCCFGRLCCNRVNVLQSSGVRAVGCLCCLALFGTVWHCLTLFDTVWYCLLCFALLRGDALRLCCTRRRLCCKRWRLCCNVRGACAASGGVRAASGGACAAMCAALVLHAVLRCAV